MTNKDDGRVFIHRVDSEGVITFVNDEWVEFAIENGAPGLLGASVVGRSLWDFIADRETRHLSRLIIDKVRSSGAAITLPYRCDSPALRRYMEMEIVPLDKGAVEFRNSIIRTEAREPVALIDMEAARSESFLTICSWCRRARSGRTWVELEEVVRALGLFSMVPMPQITHGICEDCEKLIMSRDRR